LSAILEVDDPFPGHYTLEVSSPGLTRKLTKLSHFEKSIGSYAIVAFKKGFNGPLETAGFLEKRPDGGFRLKTEEDKFVDFIFDDVARAKLDLEPGHAH
jgi:ribosome maturation factor RimP